MSNTARLASLHTAITITRLTTYNKLIFMVGAKAILSACYWCQCKNYAQIAPVGYSFDNPIDFGLDAKRYNIKFNDK